jgi:hypothetical protein
VPGIDLIDETYVAVEPAALVPRVTDPTLWSLWFPGLQRRVFMDRGENGVRWSVTGEIDGSVEVWLEADGRGTIVHWYLRGHEASDRRAEKVREHYRRVIKQGMFMLKDQAEQERQGG